MSLDLNVTAAQIEGMADELRAGQRERDGRLEAALRAIAGFPVDEYARRLEEDDGETAWAAPRVSEPPDTKHELPLPPPDYRVVAVDGSHIDVDRHLPARCFLINTGVAVLAYGSEPCAELSSEPRLYARDEELVIRDPITFREQIVEGAVLGAKRATEEVRALAQVVRRSSGAVPTLALLDGSLLVLGLSGPRNQDFVLRELVEEGFAEALEELRELAQHQRLAVASYISLPGYAEVVNALRLVGCRYGRSETEYRCGLRGPGPRPCDSCVGGVLDREIFSRLLDVGQRSATFGTSSPVLDRYYRGTGIHFFYVNVGEEIGRVEIPSWVADDERLAELVHSLVVEQCRRGQGYPVALMEAHEQAVVRGADRRFFVQAVERALQTEGLPVYSSEKDRSKRLRPA